jgi:hypothetical protein
MIGKLRIALVALFLLVNFAVPLLQAQADPSCPAGQVCCGLAGRACGAAAMRCIVGAACSGIYDVPCFGQCGAAAAPPGGGANAVNALTSTLCNIIDGVRSIVGIVALAMFLIGGILYAVAHFMPSAGQYKGAIQGWSMGMIIGGVIGIILVILAPIIITAVLSFNAQIQGVASITCP